MKRILLFSVAGLLLLCLLVPTTDIVSPDWTALVTDIAGRPIEGASVTVFSQQYTVESTHKEETKIAGDDGYVHFSERRIHAIGLVRLLGVISNLLGQGVHASFGVHTYLYATKKGYGYPSKLELFGENERESQANGLARQSSRIVLQECSPGYSGFGCDFPDDPAKPILPLQH